MRGPIGCFPAFSMSLLTPWAPRSIKLRRMAPADEDTTTTPAPTHGVKPKWLGAEGQDGLGRRAHGKGR